MTYYVWALESTPARLCHAETRTTDSAVADMVAAHYEALGFIVTREARS